MSTPTPGWETGPDPYRSPPPSGPVGPMGPPPGPGVPPPPGPPPGPGVQPPFVAAPVEGRGARVGLGLGMAGVLLAACCGVGVVAVGGILVLSEQVLQEQARAAVDDYLAAVVAEDWEEAYELRCRPDRTAESLAEFRQRLSAEPPIESYEVGDLAVEAGGSGFEAGDMRVTVELTYQDGTSTVLDLPVAQHQDTGAIEVCERG